MMVMLGVFIWIGLIGSALPEVVPGRGEKDDSLKSDSPILIFLKWGDRIESVLDGMNKEALVLMVGSKRHAFPREGVAQAQARADPIVAVLRIGACGGALSGILLGAFLANATTGGSSAVGAVVGGATSRSRSWGRHRPGSACLQPETGQTLPVYRSYGSVRIGAMKGKSGGSRTKEGGVPK